MLQDTEKQMLETVARVLGNITGMQVDLKHPKGVAPESADTGIIIRHDDMEVSFAVEIRSGLTRPAAALAIEKPARRDMKVLLVATYVNPNLADFLREADISFVDTVGNAYIHAPPLFIFLKGNKPENYQKPVRPTGRVFRARGLQVVFALLCNSGLENEPFRKIAGLTGVSLGTVNWIMKELIAMDFMRDPGKGRRRLVRKDVLMRRWVEAYPEQLMGKILKGCYAAKDAGWWRKADIKADGGLWGGEVAAARLTEYLKPEVVRIYVKGTPGKLLVKNRLTQASQGTIEILDRFWDFELDWPHKDLVPPLLIYADLMATGDTRNVETARIIHEEHLARFIRED